MLSKHSLPELTPDIHPSIPFLKHLWTKRRENWLLLPLGICWFRLSTNNHRVAPTLGNKPVLVLAVTLSWVSLLVSLLFQLSIDGSEIKAHRVLFTNQAHQAKRKAYKAQYGYPVTVSSLICFTNTKETCALPMGQKWGGMAVLNRIRREKWGNVALNLVWFGRSLRNETWRWTDPGAESWLPPACLQFLPLVFLSGCWIIGSLQSNLVKVLWRHL